jgi:hypothetical protein
MFLRLTKNPAICMYPAWFFLKRYGRNNIATIWKGKHPSPMETENKTSTYTCREYREEMILLALQKKLSAPDLTTENKQQLLAEIAAVEARMGMD